MDFINKENDVFKRIHHSKAETCIKTVDAISTEKSTVFISSSIGCPLKCKFCHLTIKNHRYSKLSEDEIVNNTVSTVNWASSITKKIKEKDLKLSWMGMGDAFFSLPIVLHASQKILASTDSRGLDKIDVSTALPKQITDEDFNIIKSIDYYYKDVRWFYSLFSVNENTRRYMIPNTHTVHDAIDIFRRNTTKIIAHQIWLDGVNDSKEEVNDLINFVNNNSDVIRELRVLRYNECDNSWWFESNHYEDIMGKIRADVNVPIKEQISPGKEIKAACGMFHRL